MCYTIAALLAAGVCGFLLGRLPGTSSDDDVTQRMARQPAQGVGAKPVSSALPQSVAATFDEGTRQWPAGVPAAGEALRNHLVNILNDSDPVERTFGYLRLLRCATKENISEFYAAWDSLRKQGIGRGEVEQPLNFRSGELDGQAALGKRRGTTYDLSVAKYLAVQLAGWNKGDPEAARRWVEGLEDGVFREQMIETMVSLMAERDLTGSERLLQSLPEDMQRNAGAKLAGRVRELKGLGSTLDWLAELAAKPGKAPAWAEPAAAAMIQDGIRVKQMAGGVAQAMAERMNQSVVTTERLEGVGRSFVLADPEAALDWAAGVEKQGSAKAPPGSLLSELISNVYDDKLPAAGEWLKARGAFAGRDEVVMAYCQKLLATDPDKAKEWASTITDPALRESALAPER